jgi:hypothetical protein
LANKKKITPVENLPNSNPKKLLSSETFLFSPTFHSSLPIHTLMKTKKNYYNNNKNNYNNYTLIRLRKNITNYNKNRTNKNRKKKDACEDSNNEIENDKQNLKSTMSFL